MKKNNGFRKILLVFVLLMTAAAAVLVPYLTWKKYSANAQEFIDDGYMLVAVNGNTDSNSINEQRYFVSGEKYRLNYNDKVVFNDINGDRVTAEKENFIHYSNGSMGGLTQSVIFDTDEVKPNTQLSYYSLSNETVLLKNGNRYIVNNYGGVQLNIGNFLWKISNDRYMVVSKNIALVVSNNVEQTFSNYLELRYIDEGIVHLVTQDGTYSTISSDAYLLLENGYRIYIGSKNLSDGQNVIMNLSEMVVGSDDNVEIIPDKDYTIESDKQPSIIVNANDGENGKPGSNGKPGTSGLNGKPGEEGNKGNSGINGKDGKLGLSAYEQAIADGSFSGSYEDWYESLTGEKGHTAYQDAVNNAVNEYNKAKNNGFAGTIEDWYESLKQDGVSDYDRVLADNIFVGTIEDWNNMLQGVSGNQFEAIVRPAFYNVVLEPDSYGVDASFDYNSNGCTVTDVFVSIVEKSTGTQLWIYRLENIYDNNTVSADVLADSTEYLFNIYATYLDLNNAALTQLMHQESFTTDGLGVNVALNHSTDNAVFLDLSKELGSKVTEVEVKLTDENHNDIAYAMMLSDNDVSGNTYTIEDLEPGIKLPIKFENLRSDSTYYVRVEALKISGDNDVSIIPSGTAKYTEVMTLKKAPVISEISVTYNDALNSFSITPGTVTDTNHGITSYRYEIYEEGLMDTPVFVKESDALEPADVKVEGNIRNNISYMARLVAVFDNNLNTVEYTSPDFGPFKADSEGWPTVEIRDGLFTASTIEGKLIIKDPGNMIPENANIRVNAVAVLSLKDEYGSDYQKNYNEKLTEVQLSDTYKVNENEYQIPFTGIGLKANQKYKLTVYADGLYVDEIYTPMQNNAFAYSEITTGNYDNLLIGSINNNDKDIDHRFSISVVFTPGTDTNIVSDVVTNLSDLSGRSMSYIRFDIYDSVMVDGIEVPSANPVGYTIKTLNAYETENLNPLTYDFSGTSLYRKSYSKDGVSRVTGELFKDLFKTKQDYLPDYESSSLSDLEKEANAKQDAENHNGQYLITLTEEDFGNALYNYGDNAKFYIRATVYDYTFGNGEEPLNGFAANMIPVGNTMNYVSGSDEDPFIEIDSKMAPPAVPESNSFYENDGVLTKGYALERISQYNSTNSNITEEIADEWSQINDDTYVGITYSADNQLARYCSTDIPSVRYGFFDENGNTVCVSDWLNADGNKMPAYTFFVNADKNTDGTSKVSRGDVFSVTTTIILKDRETDANGSPLYFPDNYVTGETRITDYICLSKQMPELWMLPYEGDTLDNINDVLVYQVNDPDNALLFNNGSPLITAQNGEVTVDVTAVNDANYNGFEAVEVSVLNNSPLMFNYSLVKQFEKTDGIYQPVIEMINTAVKEADINKGTSLKFVENDSEGNTNTYVEIEEGGRYADIHFSYAEEDVDTTNENSLLGVVLTFINSEKEQVIISNPEVSISNDLKVSSDGNYYRDAFAKVDTSNFYSIINGETIGISIELVSDSGKYGVHYIDENTSSSRYYLIEEADGTYRMNNDSSYLNEKQDMADKVNSDEHKILVVQQLNETVFSYDHQGLKANIKETAVTDYSFSDDKIIDSLPTVQISGVTSGMTTAQFDINMNRNHTLDPSLGLLVGYKKAMSNDEMIYIALGFTEGQYEWNVALNGLDRNTAYNVEVYGYSKNKDASDAYENNEAVIANWEKIYSESNGPTVTTLNEYVHENSETDTLVKNYYSISNPENIDRNSKHVVYTLNIRNVSLYDVERSLREVELTLQSEDGTALETKTISLNELKNAYSDNLGGIVMENEFAFNPLQDRSGESLTYPHQLKDEGSRYQVKSVFTYADGTSSSNTNSYQLNSFETGGSRFNINVLPETLTDNNGSIDYVLNFRITGQDDYRLFANKEGTDNVIPAIAVLRKQDLSDNNDQIVDIKAVEFEIGSDRRITNRQISFDGLDASSKYYLELYAVIDNENMDLSAITKSAEAVKAMSETELNKHLYGDENNDPIFNYKKTSVLSLTDSESITISSIRTRNDMTEKKYTVTGTNLNKIAKIEYTYKIGDGSDASRILEGSSLTSAFVRESDSYALRIDELDLSSRFTFSVSYFAEETNENGVKHYVYLDTINAQVYSAD